MKSHIHCKHTRQSQTKQVAKVIWQRPNQPLPLKLGVGTPPCNTMFLGFPRVSTQNRISADFTPPTSVTDRQTLRSSIAIVRIACIRCGNRVGYINRTHKTLTDEKLKLKKINPTQPGPKIDLTILIVTATLSSH